MQLSMDKVGREREKADYAVANMGFKTQDNKEIMLDLTD